MSRRRLRIGITIGLHAERESLWINGIKQNALFLCKLLQASPLGHHVQLLNTTGTAITAQLPWDIGQFPTVPFDAACHALDVVIELGGQISADQTARIKARGTRLVSYCCGPEYVQNIEAMVFDRPLWDSIFVNRDYDELWVIPQIVESTLPFLKAFRRCPARAVPFVWDPMAIEAASAALADHGEYRPVAGPKRLTVIEPNIDVLKFCLYPILAVELAFRAAPDRIDFLHVANADRMVHANREFAGLMRHLDIVNAHKAAFIGRVETPRFLGEYTDIVLSHQWGLPLNYFYLECCWQGYPLIHNADIVRDLGYHYPANDIEAAAGLLLDILENHDARWQTYRATQRDRIGRFMASNPGLVAAYDDLLFALVDGEEHLRDPMVTAGQKVPA